MMKLISILMFVWVLVACGTTQELNKSVGHHIGISSSNPSYFAYADGRTYIPVGINMINPSGSPNDDPDSAFREIESWMKNLSANGGNYIRVWLSQSFWDIEEVAGKYSENKAKRIDRFIAMARKYRLKIKMTLEHFRSITLEENPQQWATKFAYHKSKGGPLDSVEQYITSDAGHQLFLKKIDYYQKRYGSDTLFFGWELWNEMNAVSVPRDTAFILWNEKMLLEVKTRFPENLVMQSLGSFDDEEIRPLYNQLMLMPGNQVAQIHRYLDLGAEMEVCHAPMDIIASSAIEELLSYKSGKPVILAETGAVEPKHAGPSKYYMRDTAGILLHDILFAPFFAGSAGPGMSWHWESYVHKNDLWYHYNRFNQLIQDIDPVMQNFKPSKSESNEVRIYMLRGSDVSLLWLRDKQNTWETELEKGIPARTLQGIMIDLSELGASIQSIEVFDPWKNVWLKLIPTGSTITIPDFKRSVALRISHR